MKTEQISLPQIVSRKEWLDERKKLLKKEKEFTAMRDKLNSERRCLPMVEIKKEYNFEGPDGKASLLDLFNGCHQLIIYHFMFDPEWNEGCPSCSAWADQIGQGHLTHLRVRSTALAMVSRAPADKITAFKQRMNWKLPWYSSFGSDFNYDFHVTQDESVAPVMYNYRDKATLEHLGQHYHIQGEQPGISCFLRIDNTVYHTYSTFGRGLEQVGGTYYFLDMTALGRQEEWEEPKGRAMGFGVPAGSDKILYPDE